jgi:hypothetical protein
MNVFRRDDIPKAKSGAIARESCCGCFKMFGVSEDRTMTPKGPMHPGCARVRKLSGEVIRHYSQFSKEVPAFA